MNQIDDIYTAIKMHISNDFFFWFVCEMLKSFALENLIFTWDILLMKRLIA